uniref:Uncharacterized protein n=1 Tax=Coptotermes formosanus TaxID=36987 RepID=R4UL24_COPFO|nr:hypothetical protein [Coptotermes formosanus]
MVRSSGVGMSVCSAMRLCSTLPCWIGRWKVSMPELIFNHEVDSGYPMGIHKCICPVWWHSHVHPELLTGQKGKVGQSAISH